MIVFTIHIYTTDWTEGVVINEDSSLTAEAATQAWWQAQPAIKHKEIPREKLFAVQQDFIKV